MLVPTASAQLVTRKAVSQANFRAEPLGHVLRRPCASSWHAFTTSSQRKAIGEILIVTTAVGMAATSKFRDKRRGTRKSQVALRVRRPSHAPLVEKKVATATLRIPMWKFSEEMYFNRQKAPDKEDNKKTIWREQHTMKARMVEQQLKDMSMMEREISGFRLPPRYPLGELRMGMWLEGRVTRTTNTGVMVDVGAYTERGEWIDGHLHCGQMREDGRYVALDQIMGEVYLGETLRVRVEYVAPAFGKLTFSCRREPDLPHLFMGEPRRLTPLDLKTGHKYKAVVRRVWRDYALVDVGADRLYRVHARDAEKKFDKWGHTYDRRGVRFATEAFCVGSELDVWVKKEFDSLKGHIRPLMCNRPRSPDRPEDIAADRRRERNEDSDKFFDPGKKPEFLTEFDRANRERAQAEKEKWDPYVPYVDEWLADSEIPDETTDSWVEKAERELFEEDAIVEKQALYEKETILDSKEVVLDMSKEMDLIRKMRNADLDPNAEDDIEEFAQTDDFIEDDFFDTPAFDPEAEGPASTELDGWVLEDKKTDELAENDDADSDRQKWNIPDPYLIPKPKMTAHEIEDFLDADDDESYDESASFGRGV